METDVQQTPFLKQLVDSDPAARDMAFELLRTYLTSGRAFNELELLKLWKGLYYSLYHTPLNESNPLLTSLSALTLSLPASLFTAWCRAFWITIGVQVPHLDAHRVDKFLTLQRRMLGAQLTWLARAGWSDPMLRQWVDVLQHPTEGPLGLGGAREKIGDGVRYHVLDVLPDELQRVDDAEKSGVPKGVLSVILQPVQALAKDGKGKVLKKKAKEVLDDEGVVALLMGERGQRKKVEHGREDEHDDDEEDDEDDEWEGLD